MRREPPVAGARDGAAEHAEQADGRDVVVVAVVHVTVPAARVEQHRHRRVPGVLVHDRHPVHRHADHAAVRGVQRLLAPRRRRLLRDLHLVVALQRRVARHRGLACPPPLRFPCPLRGPNSLLPTRARGERRLASGRRPAPPHRRLRNPFVVEGAAPRHP
eukprot:3858279-Rhodomonas_salina.1